MYRYSIRQYMYSTYLVREISDNVLIVVDRVQPGVERILQGRVVEVSDIPDVCLLDTDGRSIFDYAS